MQAHPELSAVLPAHVAPSSSPQELIGREARLSLDIDGALDLDALQLDMFRLEQVPNSFPSHLQPMLLPAASQGVHPIAFDAPQGLDASSVPAAGAQQQHMQRKRRLRSAHTEQERLEKVRDKNRRGQARYREKVKVCSCIFVHSCTIVLERRPAPSLPLKEKFCVSLLSSI